MKKLSPDVNAAFESECAHSMEDLIVKKNKQDFDSLIEVIDSDSAPQENKAKALYALGRWGDKAAVSAIIKAVPELDEVGRISAVDALGRLESKQSTEKIMELAQDSSPYVRKFVAQSLIKMKKPEATKLLKSMKAKENVGFVREVIQ